MLKFNVSMLEYERSFCPAISKGKKVSALEKFKEHTSLLRY